MKAITEMTNEEIRVRCAEITGWKRVKETRMGESNRAFHQSTKCYWISDMLPRFTESADTALSLCVWMAEKGWGFSLEREPDSQWFTAGFTHHALDAVYADASTPSLAICRAFIIANQA